MGLVTLQRTLRFTDDPEPLSERELDLAVAEFREDHANPFAYHPDYSLPPSGACTVQTRRGFVLDAAPKPGSLPSVRNLDAGGALSVATGNGGTPVPKRTVAVPGYLELLGGRLGGVAGSTLVLNPPAALTVSGTGGADVGAFEVAVPSPAAIQWTNRAQLAVINRSAGTTVSWTGAAGETVWIWGGAADGATDATVVFSCLAPASAGSFTIPARVLSRVPPLRTRRSQTNSWLGVADLNSGNLRQFEAGGLDRGFADSFAQVVSVVQYR
jgi:hypothetical protein